MSRLFVSHSSRDNVYALAFQSWLTANGWAKDDVFIDLHGIGAGQRWRDTLRKANASCEAVVLLASPESLASIECQKELELAEALGKEIILAIIRDLTKDDPSLARFSERQFVDLSGFPRDHHEAIEYEGRGHRIDFNLSALASIKGRLDELGIAPGSFAWPPKDRPKAEPYPGLAAFGEDEAGIFFGREADILAALTKIRFVRRRRSPRVVLVDAASGAGKSSFLRAGLWPRLRRDPDFAPLAIVRPAQGILTGPSGLGRQLAPWFERHGRAKAPGDIHAIIRGVNLTSAAKGLSSVFAEASELATATRRAATPDAQPPSLLLAIDQAEELFGSENDLESWKLLVMLTSILKAPPDNVDLYVLATIRADSMQSLLVRIADLGVETPEVVLLPPLSHAAYREVILRPAEVYSERVRRLTIEPVLVRALVEDASGADALPLLAFTLGRLFADYSSTGELTLAHYRQMEGAGGSIARALRDAQLRAGEAGTDANLRRLIVPRLATWDPDADQRAGAAKRLVAHLEDAVGGDRAPLAPLAEALVEGRLLTRSRDTLEVAHEALLRQPPISQWLEEDREFLVWRDRLGRERAQFEANARGLLAGRELQIAREWLLLRANDLGPADLVFIQTSVEEDDKHRSEGDLRERQRQAAEQKAALLNRTVAGLVTSLLLAILAGGAGFFAFTQQKAAEAATEAALQTRNEALLFQSRFLTSAAEQAVEQGDAATGLLLALEAMPDQRGDAIARVRPSWTPAGITLSAALRALRERMVFNGHDGAVNGLAVTADGARIVTASADGTVRVWDTKTGGELLKLRDQAGVTSVAITGDGTRIVAGSANGTARVWDAETGAELRQLRGEKEGGAVHAVAVTPDGSLIVTGWADGGVRLWDAKTGAKLLVLENTSANINRNTLAPSEDRYSDAPNANRKTIAADAVRLVTSSKGGSLNLAVKAVAVTADGKRIVTASDDNTARLWDAKSGAELLALKGHTAAVRGVALTPDGSRIITASADSTVRVWDINTGTEVLQLKGHAGAVQAVAVTSDGARIVTGSQDGTARIWDAYTGAELLGLKGHAGAVSGLAVTADRVFTASADGTARAWDIEGDRNLWGRPQLELRGHTASVRAVGVTPDGSRIVTAGADGTARVWDASTGKQFRSAEGLGVVGAVALMPDGKRVVTGGDDGTVWVWDFTTGTAPLKLTMHSQSVLAIAVSTDGARIITASSDATAYIWDAKTGNPLLQLKTSRGTVNGIAVSADYIVTASDDRTARVWDARTGAELRQLRGHSDIVRGVALAGDGARVVTGSYDGTGRIWDAKTGMELLRLKGHSGAIYSVALTPDGTRAVTASDDNSVRVWDTATGTELLKFLGHKGTVYSLAVTPDGGRIISGSDDGTARAWLLPPSGQALMELARKLVPRCLTLADLQRFYLPPALPSWCGAMQKWPYDGKMALR